MTDINDRERRRRAAAQADIVSVSFFYPVEYLERLAVVMRRDLPHGDLSAEPALHLVGVGSEVLQPA